MGLTEGARDTPKRGDQQFYIRLSFFFQKAWVVFLLPLIGMQMVQVNIDLTF